MTPCEQRWASWKHDNQGRYPTQHEEFVRSVYVDGWMDGKHHAEHTKTMSDIARLSQQIEKQT